MKTYFIWIAWMLMSIINVSAQNSKSAPYDYFPKEGKYISIETSYVDKDSVKILFVTVTNKSDKNIRVFNGINDGAFSILYLNGDDEIVAERFLPLGHEPNMNQKIILKPGAGETFRYRAYLYRNKSINHSYRGWSVEQKKGPIRKMKINYYVSYKFMEEKDPYKVLFLDKETEPVSLF